MHLTHVDCDPDSNLDLGPGALVNVPHLCILYSGVGKS